MKPAPVWTRRLHGRRPEGAPVGVHAPLELGEDLWIVGADLAEGHLVIRLEGIAVDEVPELRFGAAEAGRWSLQ